MKADLPIVMAHELDPSKGGCPFERFFTTTPSDLIQGDLYKALAFACFPGAMDRLGSLASIAKHAAATLRCASRMEPTGASHLRPPHTVLSPSDTTLSPPFHSPCERDTRVTIAVT